MVRGTLYREMEIVRAPVGTQESRSRQPRRAKIRVKEDGACPEKGSKLTEAPPESHKIIDTEWTKFERINGVYFWISSNKIMER